MMFVDTEELIHENDVDATEDFVSVTEENVTDREKLESLMSSTTSSEEKESYEPESKKQKWDKIPLEDKIKAVTLAKLHPKWSLKTLQRLSFAMEERY